MSEFMISGRPPRPGADIPVNVNIVGGSLTGSDGAVLDGVSSSIKASVLDLTTSNPQAVAIVDANGDQISSFGGGTQYADGAARGTATGTIAMVDDGTNIQSQAGDSSGNATAVGNVASGVADSGNPVKVGGKYNSTKPTLTDGQRGDLQLGTRGSLSVQIGGGDSTSFVNVVTPGDAVSVNTSLKTFSAIATYNGTTTDIARSAANATNSTGTGILATGILAQFDDTSPTAITENQFGNIRMSANRNLYGTIRDAAGNERGANVDSNNNLGVVLPAETTKVLGVTRTADGSGNLLTSTGNALDVNIASGASSGTQYTEDAAAAANPVGTALNLIRDDARGGSLTSTDGDNVAARGTNAGELYVKHVDSIPVTDNGGSLTVDGTVAISGTVAVTQSGTWDEVGINDSGNSITVDAPVGTPVFVRLSDGAAAIATLPVSLASVPSHAVTNAGTFAVQSTNQANSGVDIGDVTINNASGASAVNIQDGGNSITVDGTITSTNETVSTATLTNVASSATSVQLLASTAGRKGAYFYNDSTASLYLKFGTTASTTSFTVLMRPNDYYEIAQPVFTGRIDGIWSAANGSARITELT